MLISPSSLMSVLLSTTSRLVLPIELNLIEIASVTRLALNSTGTATSVAIAVVQPVA